MAKGKRKGKNKSYPVGHPMHQQSAGRSSNQATRNERQVSDSNNAMPRRREEEARANGDLETIPLPGTSSDVPGTSRGRPLYQADVSDILDDIKIKDDRKLITTGLPAKQAPGKLGEKINLINNLYLISVLPSGNIYHYDVKIANLESISNKPEDKKYNRYRCLNTKTNREIIEKLLVMSPHFRDSFAVYDGESNLYTASALQLEFPFVSGRIRIDNENRGDYSVRIKPVEKKNAHGIKVDDCTINLSVLHELSKGNQRNVDNIQEAVMALETILRHSPALRFLPIGRNFFHPKIGGTIPLNKSGIEIWFGYHQSLHLGQWNLMVNLNTSATTFFQEQRLIDYVASSLKIHAKQLQNLTNIENKSIQKLSIDLKNVKIETYHQRIPSKMTYRIVKITKENARELKFELDSKMVSVADYFNEKYEPLKYPHLPCVQVKPEKKKRYLPLEVCFIPEGQHSRKELTDADKREMIKFTADPPKNKFSKIEHIRNRLANYDDDNYAKAFGLQVESKLVECPGRILPAPSLEYKNQKIQPKNGQWNLRGLEFYGGSNIKSWALLSLASEDYCKYRYLKYFSNSLQKIAIAAGIKLGFPTAIKIVADPNEVPDSVINKVRKELSNVLSKGIQLTIVVNPDKNKLLYRYVKQIAENNLGLMTQCIDHNNVINCNPSLLGNLCLKINGKMGGINHTLCQGELPQIMGKPVIVIGADVSHAPVTDKSGISVAAIAGTLDMILSRFATVCKLQKHPKASKKSMEIIPDLKEMVKTLLKNFYNHTKGKKPEKIIFYRDGVSDGHFFEVKEKEVKAVRQACVELQSDYQPAITFVVVQKRHQIRGKPEDSREGRGADRNNPPGTVIDTVIVHPVHRDFFLYSQFGLKGTSRPPHYTVLEDDSEFSADDLQKLTYYTCNISFRCSKSISIPVPVAYADLAAYRTRLRLATLSDAQKERQIDNAEILQETLDATVLKDAIKNSMYFL